ncbi:MAG: pitrilysin family protein [Pseudomonadota bacterium]
MRHALFFRSTARLAGAFAFFCLLLPAPLQAGVFNPESFTLENGLQVVVVPNPRIPAVTHMVWYKVGAIDEAPGKSGLAHFLEHLMFKGTKTLKPGEFSQIVARHGGHDNAFTAQDFTAYYQTIASDRLERVMRMEADRMVNLALTDAIVLPERDVVLEERRMRFENDPSAMLSLEVEAMLYRNHPYRKPIIGWAHEIASLTTEDALRFYRRHYAPNNAILVVAGDVTAKTLRPLAEKIYGAIPAREIGTRAIPTEPPLTEDVTRRVVLHSTEIRQPLFLRRYLAPNQRTAKAGEAEALQVLAEILGGGGTSRLYRGLVVDQKIAATAAAHYDPVARGPAAFSIQVVPAPGVAVEKVEAAVDAEIENLARDGVTETEAGDAVRRLQAAAIYARDGLDTGAQVLGAALASGLTIEDVESWPARIGKVTAGDVRAAAADVFDRKRSVTGFLLPKKPGGTP